MKKTLGIFGSALFVTLALMPARADNNGSVEQTTCPTSQNIPPTPPCDTQPSDKVLKELARVKAYRDDCLKGSGSKGNLAPNANIGINDLSGNKAIMYVFKSDGSPTPLSCFPVDYGGGVANFKAAPGASFKSCEDPHVTPKACTTASSHLTPPGIHVAGKCHQCPVEGSCMQLSGLQGQGTQARSVFIHHGNDSGSNSCTLGCTGVENGELQYALWALGGGAIVDNYFGDEPNDRTCSDTKKLDPDGSKCQVDAGTSSTDSGSMGSSGVAQ